MNKIMKRRDALKVTAAVGGLFALAGTASAAINGFSKQQKSLEGNWLYQGQPCAILQQGAVLICINQVGSLGTGVMTGKTTFVIQNGFGWDIGLVAEIATGGNLINWSNATQWQRA